MVDAFEPPGRHPYRSAESAIASREGAADGDRFAAVLRVALAAICVLRAGLDLVFADMTAGGLGALAVFFVVALLPSP